MSTKMPPRLQDKLTATGYFPDFVSQCLARSLCGEEVCGEFVHSEATFSHESVGRHLTVLAFTATRLLILHTDEGNIPGEKPQAITTTESIPLHRIEAAAMSQLVSNPEKYDPTATDEVWLALSWGATARIDLELANCPDPNCDADHGYTGSQSNDDFTLRVSAHADGLAHLNELLDFGARLQYAIGQIK